MHNQEKSYLFEMGYYIYAHKEHTDRNVKCPNEGNPLSSRPWFLYLVRTRENTLYTGISVDVKKRFLEHEQGKQGAKYLRAKGPLQLVYSVEVGSRSLASKAEYRLKRLAKAQKEIIVEKSLTRAELLQRLKLAED